MFNRKRKKKKNRNSIDFSDLHKGDYVVHESHGIGRFEGIGWGTLVIAPINGTVIGLFCRLFDKYFDFPPVFGKFAAHFELDKKQ